MKKSDKIPLNQSTNISLNEYNFRLVKNKPFQVSILDYDFSNFDGKFARSIIIIYQVGLVATV